MASITRTSSITEQATTEDFLFQVGRRKIANHTSFTRFGVNPAVSTTEETLWYYGGTYNFLSAATQLLVSSSSANDTAAGTGARTIQIIGMDSEFNISVEVVTLNGQNTVTTSKSFLRVLRAFNLTAGTGQVNEGDIYIHNSAVVVGVPSTATAVYAVIPAAQGQTQQVIHTIPVGFTGYIIGARYFAGRTGNNYATFKIKSKPNNVAIGGDELNAIRVINTSDIKNSIALDYPVPIQVTQKTDVWIDVAMSSGTVQLSGGLDLVIVKEIDKASAITPAISLGT